MNLLFWQRLIIGQSSFPVSKLYQQSILSLIVLFFVDCAFATTNRVATPLTVNPYTRVSVSTNTHPSTNQTVTSSAPQIQSAAPAIETLQTPAERQIIPAPGGAVAFYGAHKVGFSLDINNLPGVNLVMRDGIWLKSHIYGLCYYGPDGQGILFAQLRNVDGEIVNGNQVLYEDAFTGASADVQYTYTDMTMEQDIIIRKQLPTPESVGLDSTTARLAVITEFFDAPHPHLRSANIDLTDLNLEQYEGIDNTLPDQVVAFNTMQMGKGRAFTLGDTGEDIPVGKTWLTVNGRTFLIEATPYSLIESQLDELPSATAQIISGKKGLLNQILLQAAMPDNSTKLSHPMRLGMIQTSSPGVVLDYLISSTPLLNVQFGGSPNPDLGFAAIGQTAFDFWNQCSPSSTLFTMTNLLWSTTNGSGASITVSNATGAWGFTVPDPMYETYIYPIYGGNVGITISNLATGIYDFFFYGHGNADAQNSIFQLTTGGTNYGTKATAISSEAWQSIAWQEGQQFVTFRSVSVTSNQPIYITSLSDGEGYAIINGMQIVADNPRTNISSLINIDVAPGSIVQTGVAAVGLTTNDLWNSSDMCGYDEEGTLTTTALQWSDGYVSPVSFTMVNGGGCWGFTTSNYMYAGYSYSVDGNPVVMILSNLSNGRYDFYLYGHGDQIDQNGIFQLSTCGIDYGTEATADSGTAWQPSAWQEGQQFVAFRDVWVTNGMPVTINALVNSPGYGIINGLQVVLPTPSDDTDSNGDGLPDWWLEQYGYNPHANVTNDTYGVPLLLDYIRGRNPHVATTNDASGINDLKVYSPLK